MSDPIAPDSFVGERISGRFVVERAIGHGPLSTAFRATDQLLQRRVTVKLFHPQHPDDVAVVDSQLELATAVARLSHPNIATVIDRGEHEGMPFLVLEYVRGENLQERVDRYAPLPVHEVVGFGAEIARALAYAHAQGVVHGNLRPANVLISEDREVKLVDFGGGSYLATLTGTDPYLAPERRLFDGHAIELSPAEDVYALGVLLFVALTEQSPAPGGIDPAALQMLRPDASPRLAAVVARAMAEVVEDRHASMHELASDLAAARPADAGRAVRPDATTLAPWEIESDARAGAPAVGDAADTAESTMVGVAALEPPDPVLAGGERPVAYRSPRELRARALAWSVVLLPLAAIVLVGIMIAGERGTSSKERSGAAAHEVGDLAPMKVVNAGSFDPPPYGDHAEHADVVPYVHDGDPGDYEHSWTTEGYDQGLGLKDGVGVWVRVARPVQAWRLRVASPPEPLGWGYTVYASGPGPKPALAQWHKVSAASFQTKEVVNVKLDTHGKAYDTYMVWITRLSLDGFSGHDGKFRARVGELTVYAEAG